MDKIYKIIFFNIFILLTVSCSSDLAKVDFSSMEDFENIKIIPLGTGIADGLSYLYIEIHIKNSNGSPVVNFNPQLNIPSATLKGCGPTNELGISKCGITSTLSGIKTVSLTNTPNDTSISENIMFVMPSSSQSLIESVSASNYTTLPSGHKINTTLDDIEDPVRTTLTSGHTVYTGALGLQIKYFGY